MIHGGRDLGELFVRKQIKFLFCFYASSDLHSRWWKDQGYDVVLFYRISYFLLLHRHPNTPCDLCKSAKKKKKPNWRQVVWREEIQILCWVWLGYFSSPPESHLWKKGASGMKEQMLKHIAASHWVSLPSALWSVCSIKHPCWLTKCGKT